jgi:CheY-like chemotaxis protein
MLNCIVLVDDDRITRELYTWILIDMAISEKVITFSFGGDALEFIDQVLPEIILVDIQMAEMDGFEFIETLQKKEYGSEMNIVAISTFFRQQDKDKLKNRGIKYCIEKPLEEEKILKLLKATAKVK